MTDLLPADELQRLRLATLGTDESWLPGTARTSVTVSDLRYALECIEKANKLWHDAIMTLAKKAALLGVVAVACYYAIAVWQARQACDEWHRVSVTGHRLTAGMREEVDRHNSRIALICWGKK